MPATHTEPPPNACRVEPSPGGALTAKKSKTRFKSREGLSRSSDDQKVPPRELIALLGHSRGLYGASQPVASPRLAWWGEAKVPELACSGRATRLNPDRPDCAGGLGRAGTVLVVRAESTSLAGARWGSGGLPPDCVRSGACSSFPHVGGGLLPEYYRYTIGSCSISAYFSVAFPRISL
jgi:hypothetical protein